MFVVDLLATAYSLGDKAAIVGIATVAGGAGAVAVVGMRLDANPDYGKAYAIGATAGTALGLLLAVLPQ